jgi:hypothetical protein
VVLESFTKTKPGLPAGSPCLVLAKDPRNTDSWLGLLVILDQDDKLKTTMNIFIMLVCMARKLAFGVERDKDL